AVVAAAATRTAEPPVTGSHVALWHQALDAVRASPLRGSGFAAPDAAAPPSAALQVAAQQGLPGLALLTAAFAWALWALALSPRSTPVVLAAGAAVAALGAEALLTPILSVPGVTAAAGFLLGMAAARPLEPR
ncbi:O-antigen polymerase, partial [Streptacidiphilus monticola]